MVIFLFLIGACSGYTPTVRRIKLLNGQILECYEEVHTNGITLMCGGGRVIRQAANYEIIQ